MFCDKEPLYFLLEDKRLSFSKHKIDTGYPLEENYIIKIGGLIFRINSIKFDLDGCFKEKNNFLSRIQTCSQGKSLVEVAQNKDNLVNLPKIKNCNSCFENIHNSIQCQNQSEDNSSHKSQCRICLCDEEDEYENPLIYPCKCIGSMKYVHLDCLMTWIKQKVISRQTESTSIIFWDLYYCELCKGKLLRYVYYKERLYDIIQLAIPDPPFIIIDYLKNGCHNSPLTFIISFIQKQNIKIGSSSNCDVQIFDQNISPIHAVLSLKKKNQIFLIDKGSRFGTSIEVKNEIQLKDECDLKFLAGNIKIELFNRKRDNKKYSRSLSVKKLKTNQDFIEENIHKDSLQLNSNKDEFKDVLFLEDRSLRKEIVKAQLPKNKKKKNINYNYSLFLNPKYRFPSRKLNMLGASVIPHKIIGDQPIDDVV